MTKTAGYATNVQEFKNRAQRQWLADGVKDPRMVDGLDEKAKVEVPVTKHRPAPDSKKPKAAT